MKFIRSVADVFGYSPFKALRLHAEICGRAVGLLQKQFHAYRKGNFEEVEKLRNEIDDLEHEADNIKDEIRSNITNSLMLLVDRHDLLNFLTIQDEIINYCEHVGHMLTFRKIKTAPKDIWDEFDILLAKIMEAVNEYERLMDHIATLVASSFSKKEVAEALLHVPEIENLEHECDMIQIGLHTKLFNADNMHPLDAHLMIEWVVHLGEIANNTARAADRFRIMVLSR